MKRLTLFLAVAALGLSVLTGCGNTEDKKGTEKQENADKETDLKKVKFSDYDLNEYVKLGDYRNLTVNVEYSEVTNERINAYANDLAMQYPEYKKTDKTEVEEGDIVNIDYVGTKDGEAFEGGTDTGYNLEIGSGAFIDGFEDGLVGVKVGETVVLNLTFPEDYPSEDLAGQDVAFEVTVNGIMEEIYYTVDEFTDEYVYSNFGFDTVDEFMADVKTSVEQEAETEKENNTRTALVEAVVADCEVTVPEELLNYNVENYKEQYTAMVEAYGYDFEEFISTYFNQTIDEWIESIAESMESSLKQEMVFTAIAEKEEIEVDEDDFESYAQQFIDYYGYQDKEALFADYPEEDLRRNYKCDQVVQLLRDELTFEYTLATEE